jgi:hypothetical protein
MLTPTGVTRRRSAAILHIPGDLEIKYIYRVEIRPEFEF